MCVRKLWEEEKTATNKKLPQITKILTKYVAFVNKEVHSGGIPLRIKMLLEFKLCQNSKRKIIEFRCEESIDRWQ